MELFMRSGSSWTTIIFYIYMLFLSIFNFALLIRYKKTNGQLIREYNIILNILAVAPIIMAIALGYAASQLLSMPSIYSLNRVDDTYLIFFSLLASLSSAFLSFFLLHKTIGAVSPNLPDAKEYVKKIFEGEEFLTALNSTLPKGDKDKEYGLDYIPFMLQNIDNRRKRFKDISGRFFLASLFTGSIFVILVIYFAFVLLNENSVGVNKTLSQINAKLEDINNALESEKSLKNLLESEFHATSSKIQSLITSKGGPMDSIIVIYSDASDALNGDWFNRKITAVIDSLKAFPQHASLVKVLIDSKLQVKEINDQNEVNERAIKSSTIKIDKLVSEAETKLSEERFRVDELIKRLILSVVVITFFIMVLRYVIRLYQFNYQQMLNTEFQDMQLRKFYVLLKSTEQDSEARKLLVEKFWGEMPTTELDNKPVITADETGILKDTINAILKKL